MISLQWDYFTNWSDCQKWDTNFLILMWLPICSVTKIENLSLQFILSMIYSETWNISIPFIKIFLGSSLKVFVIFFNSLSIEIKYFLMRRSLELLIANNTSIRLVFHFACIMSCLTLTLLNDICNPFSRRWHFFGFSCKSWVV